jgi:hypothetical protein
MSRARRHSATRAGPINRSVDNIPFNPSAGPVSRGSDFPSRGSDSRNQGKTSCSRSSVQTPVIWCKPRSFVQTPVIWCKPRSFVQTPLTPLHDGLTRAHTLVKSGTFWHFLALFGGVLGADLFCQKRLTTNRLHVRCHFLALARFSW